MVRRRGARGTCTEFGIVYAEKKGVSCSHTFQRWVCANFNSSRRGSPKPSFCHWSVILFQLHPVLSQLRHTSFSLLCLPQTPTTITCIHSSHQAKDGRCVICSRRASCIGFTCCCLLRVALDFCAPCWKTRLFICFCFFNVVVCELLNCLKIPDVSLAL